MRVVFPPARSAQAARSAVVTSGPYAQAVLADTPAAYYRLGDGGTTAADSSGNGHTGSVSASGVREGATPLLTGDANTAMRFTGNRAGYVTAARAAALEPANAVTVETWAKIAPVASPRRANCRKVITLRPPWAHRISCGMRRT